MLCLLLALLSAPALLLPAAGRAQVPPEPTAIFGPPTMITAIITVPDVGSPPPDAPVREPARPVEAATPTWRVGPDACEPNETRAAACALALDAVNGPFSFAPVGDQDWYRVELPASGLQTTFTVRGTAGLDLLTTISRDDGTPLASIASPAMATTLAPDVAGGVVIRVENRAPGVGDQEQYNLELRQALPPPPAPPEAGSSAPQPDALENNWNPATAAPIAVGVVYELNFVCPVAWGCAGGDHDYLRLPVKAGLRYLIATFDLGPGVDTVLDLFWGDEGQPLATNDDAAPGASFLSVLRWVAPADGEAILRIGPRAGGLVPTVPDAPAGSYRFAVALAESDLAHQLEERIADQTNAPTPTPTARAITPSSGVAAGPAPAAAPAAPPPLPTTVPISADAPTGSARVSVAETALREGPSAAAPVIQNLPAETVVTLLGQSSGAWVRVQPAAGVVPGWVRAVDLVREDIAATTTTTLPDPTAAAGGANGSPQPAASPNAIPVTPTSASQALVVEPLEPVAPPLLSPPVQRIPLALTVRLVAVAEPPQASAGRPPPTIVPAAARPLPAVRVHLVDAFGDVLAEALTNTDGSVTLTSSLPVGAAVFVQLPAAGLRVPVEPTQTTLLIALPDQLQRGGVR